MIAVTKIPASMRASAGRLALNIRDHPGCGRSTVIQSTRNESLSGRHLSLSLAPFTVKVLVR